MTDNFQCQLQTKESYLNNSIINGFPLRNILASAMIDEDFKQLIDGFDRVAKELHTNVKSLQSDLDDCAMTLKIDEDEKLQPGNCLPFSEYVSRDGVNNKLTAETHQTTIICSEHLTVAFEPHDSCWIFALTKQGVELISILTMNELNIIQQLICCIRGIRMIPFPKILTGSFNANVNFYRVFQRIVKCIRIDDLLYDTQLVHTRITSRSYIRLWNIYGVKMLSMMMTIITFHLFDGILYNEKALSVTYQTNAHLENVIQLISVKQAFVSKGNANLRYQFHLIFQFPIIKCTFEKLSNNAISPNTVPTNNDDLFSLLVKMLPIELRAEIASPHRNLHKHDCMCKSINCHRSIHEKECQQREEFLDDRIPLLFPISFRTVRGPDGVVSYQVYAVFTTTLDGGKFFGETDLLGDGLILEKHICAELKILNRLHFQGHTLDMNEPYFNSLQITDDDSPSFCPNCDNEKGCERNWFYNHTAPFIPAKVSCLHESEFIPKLDLVEKHYLLFD